MKIVFNIDEVGQIDFNNTPFEYNQEARLKIQSLFDELL